MEIERKFTIQALPENLADYECRHMRQAYLCTEPVVRIRQDNERYYLTYKGSGLMAREERNLPLTEEAFRHMLPKADGLVITKDRYVIPIENAQFDIDFLMEEEAKKEQPRDRAAVEAELKTLQLSIELDIFSMPRDLIMAEIEFPTVAIAKAYIPPEWFAEDVTEDRRYHNSNISQGPEDF
ncbi:MAG: CYTH domain-containing protein [Lachnospiraceae bacterium]|nr:CYTH domain-containing protein [Lachnospiraceae bacterium]